MNYSPFEIFRRNLKPLMVLLVGLAMFAFVVLPALDTYLRQSSGGPNSDPVLASFNGTSLNASRVDRFTRNHAATVRFLSELIEKTVSLDGVPSVPNAGYNSQTGSVTGVGISDQPSTDASIRALQFADSARDAGYDLDDLSIQNWLDQLTDGKISQAEINGMLAQSTQNQMGQFHLYEMIRTQLLAGVFMERGAGGLYANNRLTLTPAEHWNNFVKANRGAKAEVYGVLVADYVDKVTEKPDAAEIAAVYEEGKNLNSNNPNNSASNPGFRRPTVANFESLTATLQTFVDREVAKIPEAVIRAEYDARVERGVYRDDEEASEEPAAAAEEPTETPSAELDAPEMTEGTEDVSVEADSQPAAEETTTEPEAKKDGPVNEIVPEDPKPEPPAKPETPEPAKPEADVAEPATEDSSAVRRSSAVQLVAFQDEGDEPETAADTADTETATEEPAAEDTEPDTEGAAESEPTAEGDEATTEVPAAPEEPKVDTSFEGQRKIIAEELAMNAARVALDNAVTQAKAKMQGYASDVALFNGELEFGDATQDDAPAKPDLEALAAELGMEYVDVGEFDSQSIGTTDVGKSNGLGESFNQRGLAFEFLMFGFATRDGQVAPGRTVWSPIVTVDLQAGATYVTWKTSETEGFVPSIEDAEAEIVDVIKQRKAGELAKAAAEKFAKDAAASEDKPFADLIPAGKEANFFDNLDTFNAINPIGLQIGRIIPGNVTELDAVGEEFFDAAFGTEVGDYSVAANSTGTVYYVIKPTEFDKSSEDLQKQFGDPRQQGMARQMGDPSLSEVLRGFYENVDESTGFEEMELPN